MTKTEIKPLDLVSVFQQASYGATEEQIAQAVGIRFHRFKKLLQTDGDLATAFQRGKNEHIAKAKAVGFTKRFPSLRPNQIKVLAAYIHSGKLYQSCRAVKVSPSNHFYWINHDDEYAAAFDQAKQIAISMIEDTAFAFAHKGTQTLKFHEGQVITIPCEPEDEGAVATFDPETGEHQWRKPYVETKLNPTMIQFMLRSLNPEVYGREAQTVINNDAGSVWHEVLAQQENRAPVVLEDIDVEAMAAKRIAEHRAAAV